MKFNSDSFLTKSNSWILAVFLLLFFVGGLAIRLFDLDNLPLDFSPTRQLQSMIKARGMYYQTLSPDPEGHRDAAVSAWSGMPHEEPEIVEGLALAAYRLAGHEDLWFPRFFSIIFWLAGGIALYLIGKSILGTDGALVALVFYLFVPFGIAASRAFMPDPMNMAFFLWFLWALLRWNDRHQWRWAIAAGVLGGMAIFTKATLVFLVGMPVLVTAVSQRGLKRSLRDTQLWAMGLLCLLPAFLYNFLGIYVNGIMGNDLFSQRFVPRLLLDPVTYLQVNRLLDKVVGIIPLLLSWLGLFFLRSRRERSFMFGLWAGYLLYGLFFIYFFATHDYYHLPIIPLVALGIGSAGQAFLQKIHETQPRAWASAACSAVLIAGILQTCYVVESNAKKNDYRPEAAFWQQMGNLIQGHSTIAMSQDYNGRLAYWGWFNATYWVSAGDLESRVMKGNTTDDEMGRFQQNITGKDYFLITMLSDFDKQPKLKEMLTGHYTVAAQGNGYILFDLRNPK